MRIALAQINSVVGDIDGNAASVVDWLGRAREANADLVLFPELVVTGYPPEDLLLRPGFVHAARRAVDEIARATHGITVLVGAPHLETDLYNACFILARGEVRGVYKKCYLPNYGVFDEDRYFAAGRDLHLLRLGDVLVGPTICEDVWQPGPPATDLALAGAQLVANISASPFHVGKDREREEMLKVRATDNSCFVAMCNAVGGQDELIFDGHSVVLDDEGEVLARAAGFEEELLVVDVDPAAAVARRLRDVRRRALARDREQLDVTASELAPPRTQDRALPTRIAEQLDDLEQMRLALELGLHDYVTKNGFRRRRDRAVRRHRLRADGGALRRGARLGPRARRLDAVALLVAGDARRRRTPRDIARDRLPRARDRADGRAFTGALATTFEGRASDLTEENLQARIRGTLLMALSNKFGWLVIATGNKSELSVGYSTLYGDLAGGFALIKDVYKTDVFRLSRYLNEHSGRDLIPNSIIERAPSAELRADQLDEDSLPPYPKLDRVLEAYVELDRSREELSQDGFEPEVVERALAMIDRAEYKRRQAPPGVKLRPEGVRPRPPDADHEQMDRLSAGSSPRAAVGRRRESAASPSGRS